MEKEKSNMEYWGELIKAAPEAYKEWFQGEKEFFKRVIKKDSTVLEVGCGDGRSLKDILPITENLTGLDHDDLAISQAKDIFKNYPKVKIIKGEATNLPFEDKSFDYTTCIGTFANLADKKFQVLEEMKRVTKNNGKIVISVYSEKALPTRKKIYKRLNSPILEIKDNGTVIFDESIGDNISEQFSREQLREIFKKAKLKVEEINEVGMAYICLLSKPI